MSAFQTMISLVLLIFVLSVIVQGVQEIVKALLDMKASVMADTIDKFFGNQLPLADVEAALKNRGLSVEDLENFDRPAFRSLLDGISFNAQKIETFVKDAGAGVTELKNNIAASYDGARSAFAKAYARRNKQVTLVLSFIVVGALNANIAIMYDQISTDQVVQQTLVGQAAKIQLLSNSQQGPLADIYKDNSKQIRAALKEYPMLVRTVRYPDDFGTSIFWTFAGLIFMGVLVSLGAPFWNDVLKGLMGLNNTLNSSGT